MPSFEVEFEVYCECGEGLCMQSTGGNDGRGPKVTVEPCTLCLENAKSEGHDEGYEEAQKESEED